MDSVDLSDSFNNGDELPFAYSRPERASEGKVTWICNYDQDHKITSVFMYSGGGTPERQINYLTMEEAIKTRDILIESGWQKTKLPEVRFKSADGDTLNRKDRRIMEKAIAKKNKRENPFL